MSKEEILKIQTCVLKVNIHCDGCKQKVKKILQKIDGVYKTSIDAEQGKVTVCGNVDSATLVKKLTKAGKHAEVWGTPKPNNNNNNQSKKADKGKGAPNNNNNSKNQPNNSNKAVNNNNNNNSNNGKNNGQPNQKGGGGQQNQGKGLPQGLNPQQLKHIQQLQQQMKGLGMGDLKMAPQFQPMKMPFKGHLPPHHQQLGTNPKVAGKFNPPLGDDDDDDDEFDEDDEFDDDDDEFDDDDGEFDDEFDEPLPPVNKMKPMNMGPGPGLIMNGGMLMNPQLMNQLKAAGGGAGGGGKKGVGGGAPVQVNDVKNGNVGKKGGNGGGNNQTQGGGGGKNGGKHVGPQPGGGHGKNGGSNGGGNMLMNGGNGGKNGGGPRPNNRGIGVGMGGSGMNPNAAPGFSHNGHHGMPPPRAGPPNMGQGMGHLGPPMAQMANMQMGPMGSVPAVQGLPASAAPGPGYLPGAPPPEMMAGNPYQHQQYLAQMMMNQQQANGNERFQPMMYARPQPGMHYMPPPCPTADPYSHYFSDENTSSGCNIM